MVTFLGNALLGDNYHFYGAIITLGWPDWGMSGVSKISAVPHASLMPLFFTSTTRLYYHKAIIIHFYRKSYFTSFLTKRLQLRNWTWGNSWSGLLFCVCLSFLFVSFFVCLFAYLLVFLIACLLVCLFACLLKWFATSRWALTKLSAFLFSRAEIVLILKYFKLFQLKYLRCWCTGRNHLALALLISAVFFSSSTSATASPLSRFIWTITMANKKTERNSNVINDSLEEASIGRSPNSISPTNMPNVLKNEVRGASKKRNS